MKRNLKKLEDEGRRILESRKHGAAFCINAKELYHYMERLHSEAPIEALYDLWLFGLATGYRAGRRAAKV